MSNWHDNPNTDKVTRSGSWRLMAIIAAFTVFFVLLGASLWAFGVISSPIKGQGEAFKQQQSANNRVASQARFEDLYADIKASDAKLLPAKQALKQSPDSQIKQTEFTGLVNYCLDVVGDYNAESRKYLAEDFKAIDLPYQIDPSDPSTDCKP